MTESLDSIENLSRTVVVTNDKLDEFTIVIMAVHSNASAPVGDENIITRVTYTLASRVRFHDDASSCDEETEGIFYYYYCFFSERTTQSMESVFVYVVNEN